ncbi:MAG TPA: FAD-dependent oxidoreductase [Lentisphaeria bacterium]|nr:MAG: hypothetical protein A2X45_11560 [Lentisphaerae bacterium GWF2_50_93]HCE44021.1 FAD-dependent oxidoreductase [Lentisphaeria bacterium]
MRCEVPVLSGYDLVVVGGGPGGIASAVTAARHGVKTVLIERYGQLGGMAVVGEVQPFMPNHINHKTLDKPFYTDWLRAMRPYMPEDTPPLSAELGEWRDLRISKEAAMLAAEDLCLAAGVKILYHHTLFDVKRENEKLTAAILHGKDGLLAVTGKVFIDSTGDGDLAAKAGCDFEFGDGKEDCQPMTLCFKLSHVDDARRLPGDELTRLFQEAKKDGTITNVPRDGVGEYHSLKSDIVHFNSTRVAGKNPLKAAELSEAEMEARRQLRELFHFLRKRAPGYEKAEIHSIASTIGVRESRRIMGLSYLTIEDYDAVRKFPDAIARVNYPVDIHNSKDGGFTFRPLPDNDWYEIPYGCIVARNMTNLLLASRCISTDHIVNSSLRVMPVICSLGQAAGMAAAMAVKVGKDPSALDGKAVRGGLIEHGAKLGPFEVENTKRTNWDQP